ncbi:hypothetical protein KH5_22470 [Urechidicola sp. KH5]
MLFKGVKHKSIQKKIVKKFETLQNNSDLKIDKNSKVLLILEDKSDVPLRELLNQKFSWPLKRISTLLFNDSNQVDSNTELTFSLEHIGLFGNIKSEELKKEIDQDFDLVINLLSNDVALLLTLESNSKFRIGVDSNKANFYDLTIATESGDLNIFVNELERYLKILNKI